MSTRRVVVVGYGRVGQAAVEAVLEAPDMVLAGVIRRDPTQRGELPPHIPVVAEVAQLGKVDGALLCVPTRQVPEVAERYLRAGIHTVDSYDIHGELVHLRERLGRIATEHGAVAIISAGWDPGTNSMVRALMELMAPRGITYINYGPGMSMGHSVVVRQVPGVRDGLAITIPAGQGTHRRMVYVELEPGADLEAVRQAIVEDPYFRNDETRVIQVPSVQDLVDMGHGVRIERKGVSGRTHNQQFVYDIRINNPALTAQIMVSALRASFKQPPGAYTLLEVPLIDFLPGDPEENLRRLV